MFFLNLTVGEFLTLLGALGGLITALYLLDRTKRKKVVSTLRFWTPALTSDEQQRRRRMREPWSLLLQLASLLLLLLAIAQLQWGTRQRRGRDHVLLIDTSSWAGERASGRTVLDQEKEVASWYLSRLPGRDRVMLVRADALTTPITPFTTDRRLLSTAVRESSSSLSALNIEQALAFAEQAQSWSGGQRGEIVYIGPRLIGDSDRVPVRISNLRVITVPAMRENCGIRRLGVRRSEEDANSWQATVTLKNYGSQPRTVRLRTGFAGTAFAPRVYNLLPGQETAAAYTFSTSGAGRLTAQIDPADALPADDHAELELPRTGQIGVVVYTSRQEALRPLLEPNHRLSVRFAPPSAYNAKPSADVMLLDSFAPPQEPLVPSLWINPPKENSPLPVRTVVTNATIKMWDSSTALGNGLHAKETRISAAEVFQTFENDVPVGSLAEGPFVVARPAAGNRPKMVVVGYDPFGSQLRFELTTPLLFANVVEWLSPDAFRTSDIVAGRVGSADVTLDPNEHAEQVRVKDDRGFSVPFTVHDRTVQLFLSYPAVVRVTSDDHERILSLTLPDVADFEWKPASDVVNGLPAAHRFVPDSIDLWQWLAVLGTTCLCLEWVLFGRRRALKFRNHARIGKKSRTAAEPEREVVSR